MEGNISDGILDQQCPVFQRCVLLCICSLFAFLGLGAVPLRPGVHFVAEFALCHRVAPVAEGPFGELHDVAFMHQRHRAPSILQRVVDGRLHQALRSLSGDGFQAQPGTARKADLGKGFRLILFHPGQELLVVSGSFLKLYASVNVFGVFTEDDHVHVARLFHR